MPGEFPDPNAPTELGPYMAKGSAAHHGEGPRDHIGPYMLLEIIGEGGFGTVWLAERREPMVQRVALKVIKPGMDSKAVIARFEQERQALAVMDHPNVARVFDGGVTPHGRPYFVMEHVKGAPITAYCDQQRLTIEQRLRLFVLVCDAVQHAHMKGLIHRDLKPSNILVMLADAGEPRPVVIDFGIAKALSGRLTEHTIFTMRGELIGTPEYMSPEQVTLSDGDIDTRSDVYALGVVLYELVTGVLPFDPEVMRRAGIAELQKVIREHEPPRPTVRLTGLADAGTKIAAARRIDVPGLVSLLRRELEWILLKALRKDRTERYRSAAEFADDLNNFLSHRPVVAAPESTMYRVRKFVRRHRAMVGAGCVTAAVLIFGIAGIAWQAKVAGEQRDRAFKAQQDESAQRAEADRLRRVAEDNAKSEAKARLRAQTINSFVTEALRSADPEQGGAQSATILEAMENAQRDLANGRFKDDPETEAALQETIGTILQNNGRATEAHRLFERALTTRRLLYLGDSDQTAESLTSMGLVLEAMGRESEALPLHQEALEMRRRLHPGDDVTVAGAMANLANVRKSLGSAAEAEPLLVESLAMHRRLAPGDHPAIASGLYSLGTCLTVLGRSAEAEEVFNQSLQMRERMTSGDHPRIAQSLEAVAYARMELGRAEGSLPMFERALEMRRRLFKGDHPSVAMSINNLATAMQAAGRFEDALARFREALAIHRRLHPGDHPDVALAINNVGGVLSSLGQYAEAETEYRQAFAMYGRLYIDDHPQIAQCLNDLGYVRSMQDDPSGGADYYLQALDLRRRIFKGDHPQIAESLNNLAYAKAALGKLTENERLLRESLEMYQRLFPGDHPDSAMAMINLAVSVSKNGDSPAAERLTADAAEMYRRIHNGDHPDVAWSMANLATIKANVGRAAEGLPLAERALEMAQRVLPADHPDMEQYRKCIEVCRKAMEVEAK
ncbi:MAG: serine/threonine protein kinase [Phycisphaerales bacterium]|nr:serine/threonine protein kinase [Phycisphaerales bacterium]